ncbi:response regulator [Cohnella silvisoli]|uniref:Response regulator n=1 Tax=Cohnella silvisoli TaxID=2873699 RepID=A0ABV1KTF7_9BACL|nr:response regulator [Cohnella silvisoli]MCD9021517.1 response regulator [Cohnella silvisoli]
MLLRVLIVDDEEWTRISLREQVDWSALGMEIAGEARNGELALEAIARVVPHIVITDIRMPAMDGLKLMEQTRKSYPSVLFIMLSGYSEFEYARQAVMLQAFDYVLKPIDEEQLTETLRRAALKLDADKSFRNEWVELNKKANEAGPLTKERLLTQAVLEAGEAQLLAAGLLDRNGLSRFGDSVSVLVLEADNFIEVAANKYLGDGELTSFVLGNLLAELFSSREDAVFFRKYGERNEFIILLSAEQPSVMSSILAAMDQAERLLPFRLSGGIGRSCSSLRDLPSSYVQAIEALRNAKLAGLGSLVLFDQLDVRRSYEYPVGKEKALLTYIENGYKDQAQQLIADLTREWETSPDIHPSSIRHTALELTLSLRKIVRKHHAELEKVLGEEDLAALIRYRIRSIPQMRDWLLQATASVMSFLEDATKIGAKKAVGDIAKYMLEHYGEEISLNGVADTFHLNSAYLSRIFKQEMGQTFNDFLSHVRMEAAGKLLADESLKIHDIAPIVGYDNVSYFMKKFKEHFGITPSEYRRGTSGK